jgi:N-carbamoylputrescine amidase
MMSETLTVALITEVFHDDADGDRLRSCLEAARSRGAELAVLPELPLDPWSPATRTPRDEDAEEPEGPRYCRLSAAAAEAEIALVGGVIERDPESGRRSNTAVVFDSSGNEIGRYRKAHLPDEEGFWETDHYRAASEIPRLVRGLAMPLGIQICSDNMRPEGSHILGALGAEIIVAPRATPTETWWRWQLVLRANAVTSCSYVISVNRPGPEQGVPIGGPSVVISPLGEVLLESTDRIAVIQLSSSVVEEARQKYPGYLPIRAGLYARGWRQIAERQ